MRSTERTLQWARRSAGAVCALVAAVLAACSGTAPPSSSGGTSGAGSTSGAKPAGLPAPSSSARNWDEYRRNAALRIVAANRATTFDGPVPEPLLAIPVLSVELNGDGSVRRIEVMRHPSQARETTQIAIDAVRRAGPYGSVTNLPKPWKFTETFLFADDHRFKPRSLDDR